MWLWSGAKLPSASNSCACPASESAVTVCTLPIWVPSTLTVNWAPSDSARCARSKASVSGPDPTAVAPGAAETAGPAKLKLSEPLLLSTRVAAGMAAASTAALSTNSRLFDALR